MTVEDKLRRKLLQADYSRAVNASVYMTIQHPPLDTGAKGSSFLSTGPQTEGTRGSRFPLQYEISLLKAESSLDCEISYGNCKFMPRTLVMPH